MFSRTRKVLFVLIEQIIKGGHYMANENLKGRWATVSFETAQDARNALNEAKLKFNQSVLYSRDLSYISGNTVYLYVADPTLSQLKAIKQFLLNQPAALPDVYHI